MIIYRLTVVVLLLGITACTSVTTRKHPDIETSMADIQRVVVVPPVVEVELMTMTGENERLTDVETAIKLNLKSYARQAIRERGLEFVDYCMRDAIEADEDFAYAITRLGESFTQAKEDLMMGVPLAEEKAYSLEASVCDSAGFISDTTNADAILLIRYGGYKKSDGSRARDVGLSVLLAVATMGSAVAVPQFSGAYVEAALIDGISGDVLWADYRGGPLNASILPLAMQSLPLELDSVESQPLPTDAADSTEQAPADEALLTGDLDEAPELNEEISQSPLAMYFGPCGSAPQEQTTEEAPLESLN